MMLWVSDEEWELWREWLLAPIYANQPGIAYGLCGPATEDELTPSGVQW